MRSRAEKLITVYHSLLAGLFKEQKDNPGG